MGFAFVISLISDSCFFSHWRTILLCTLLPTKIESMRTEKYRMNTGKNIQTEEDLPAKRIAAKRARITAISSEIKNTVRKQVFHTLFK